MSLMALSRSEKRKDFDRCMHIPKGYLDQCGCHSATGNLHDVGVSAGGFRYSGELNWDLLSLGGIGQKFKERWVDIGPAW